MSNERVLVAYDGHTVDIYEEKYIPQKFLNSPLYVFHNEILNIPIEHSDFDGLQIPKIALVCVLCYEYEVENMKEDIILEYSAIREKLRETVKNNI